MKGDANLKYMDENCKKTWAYDVGGGLITIYGMSLFFYFKENRWVDMISGEEYKGKAKKFLEFVEGRTLHDKKSNDKIAK